jgi:prophage regulatory protein
MMFFSVFQKRGQFFLTSKASYLNLLLRQPKVSLKMKQQNSNTSSYTNNQQQPEKLLRWPEVQSRVGFCKSYSYVLQKKGIFPKPVKLIEGGRANGYLDSEINEFINARIEQSRREVKS